MATALCIMAILFMPFSAAVCTDAFKETPVTEPLEYDLMEVPEPPVVMPFSRNDGRDK